MIRIGVLGAGHLGSIHIKLLKQIPQYNLVGFFDPDTEKAKAAEENFQIKAFSSIDELIDASDAIDIVTPTLSHYDCAVKAIEKNKHIFIEKPLTNSVEEAELLIPLVKKANIKAQVGHVERFNPAYLATIDMKLKPMFIEAHRLSEYNPRGTDVSVVLDLMIHDIDILLSLVNSEVKNVSASGVPVISDTPDIANARIEFENGCVANLTASRVSLKKMRKTRIFQKNAYIALDFLDKKVNIIKIKEATENNGSTGFILDAGEGKPKKEILFEVPVVPEINAIKLELEQFAISINEDKTPPVTIEDGYKSLKLAHQILDCINNTELVYNEN